MAQAQIPASIRRLVAERAKHCCEYCRHQETYSSEPFSVEHISPKARDGNDALDNLAYSCQGCNNHKHVKIQAIDPLTQEAVSIYHPRLQRWDNHFGWAADYTLIVGRTPTGRATVETLHLNRKGLVNLRRALYADGQHPPAEE